MRLNQVSVLINREGTFYGQLSLLEHMDNDRMTTSAANEISRGAKQDLLRWRKIPYMIITRIGCSNHSLLQSTHSGISMSNFFCCAKQVLPPRTEAKQGKRFIAGRNLPPTQVFSVLTTRGKQIR